MNRKGTRRRALAVVIAAGVAAAGGIGVILADSAGAATPAANQALAPATQSTATPTRLSPTPSAEPSSIATSPAAAVPTPAAAKTSPSAVPSAGRAQQVQLAPTQLPAVAAEKWVAVGSPSTRDVTGHDVGENECAKVHGASTWTQQGYSGGDGENAAIQDTFVFSSAAAAKSAYQNVLTGMDSCRRTTRALQAQDGVKADASVTETASRPDADAWKRSWTGVMGMSADGPQTNHLYLAVDGTRLIVLQFTEFPGHAAPYDTAADPQVLAMLDTELAR